MKKESNLFSVKKLWQMVRSGFFRVLWLLGTHAFLCILVLCLIAVCSGEFLFYQYLYVPGMKSPPVANSSAKFEQNAYESVVSKWQSREASFKNTDGQVYQNPFQ